MSAHTDPSRAQAPSPEPAKAKRPFEFARDDGRLAKEINALFNRFTGRSRTGAQYLWEFYEGLPPRAHVWAIVDTTSGGVVGHHSIVSTPIVIDGEVVPAGRTENTIIEAAVRRKIFYPGMEKKAFKAALEDFAFLYTVHASGPQARIRERLGYRPVGRWSVFLPAIGAGYLVALLARLRDRFARPVPDLALRVVAAMIGGIASVARIGRRPPRTTTCELVTDLAALEPEYRALWEEARPDYGPTIDRSWEFLRWRVFENPNLEFSVWAIRRGGSLDGVLIGHRHQLGSAAALYVDDLIVRRYRDEAFREVLRWLPSVARDYDACVVMTLDAPTPLWTALRGLHRMQAFVLDRIATRLFDEVVVYDRDARGGSRPWYVTPVFTEGLDTSRPAAGSTGVAG